MQQTITNKQPVRQFQNCLTLRDILTNKMIRYLVPASVIIDMVTMAKKNQQEEPTDIKSLSLRSLYAESSQLCPLPEDKSVMSSLATADDTTRPVFDHVSTPVPYGTVTVLASIKKFKSDHKLILLDHLICDIGDKLDSKTITNALQFLSNIGEISYFGEEDDNILTKFVVFLSNIGEILYLGEADDNILTKFVVLSRKWLVSAVSSILRSDWKQELTDRRRLMSKQSMGSGAAFKQSDFIRTFVSGSTSSCPLLTSDDAKMLWQSPSSFCETSDRCFSLLKRSTDTPTIFNFLERLLVHTGVFIPVEISPMQPLSKTATVFFVPSLLAEDDPPDLWHYKTHEGCLATLCHSWLFRDGAPAQLMERITVQLLVDLYECFQTFRTMKDVSTGAGKKSVDNPDNQVMRSIELRQLLCFKSAFLVTIESAFDDFNGKPHPKSVVEAFVSMADQGSLHAVASSEMLPNMQRLIVCCKGDMEDNGVRMWKGGYNVILESVRKTLSKYSNIDAQAICPECLATSSPRCASTWGWDSVLAASRSSQTYLKCAHGHEIDSHSMCGTCPGRKKESLSTHMFKPLNISFESIVLVAVWDPKKRSIVTVGSGFVADKKCGLIVTAARRDDSEVSLGLPDIMQKYSNVIIGVIPDGGSGKHAVFRYIADVITLSSHTAGACVLQIRSRLRTDVDCNADWTVLADEARVITLDKMPEENLKSFKMTKHFELEEHVRFAWYTQSSEGFFGNKQHKPVYHYLEVVQGQINSHLKQPFRVVNTESNEGTEDRCSSSSKEEIVVMLDTISRHYGGPCINNDGKVVGILSRFASKDQQRCYLVPATEIRELLSRARGIVWKPGNFS